MEVIELNWVQYQLNIGIEIEHSTNLVVWMYIIELDVGIWEGRQMRGKERVLICLEQPLKLLRVTIKVVTLTHHVTNR